LKLSRANVKLTVEKSPTVFMQIFNWHKTLKHHCVLFNAIFWHIICDFPWSLKSSITESFQRKSAHYFQNCI